MNETTKPAQTPTAPATGSELLPCPFCGGASLVSECANLWRAGCPICPVETQGFFNREEAVEVWNQREDLKVDRLRSALEAARKHILERNGLCRDADRKAAMQINRVLSLNPH